MPRNDANKGRRELARERALQAFDLRKGGASFRAIGKTLGVSEAQAHRYIMGRLRELAKLEIAAAEDMRKLEFERLDALLLGCWNKAVSGDVPSIQAAVNILKRRASLLGIDAPTRITGPGGGPVHFTMIIGDEPTSVSSGE